MDRLPRNCCLASYVLVKFPMAGLGRSIAQPLVQLDVYFCADCIVGLYACQVFGLRSVHVWRSSGGTGVPCSARQPGRQFEDRVGCASGRVSHVGDTAFCPLQIPQQALDVHAGRLQQAAWKGWRDSASGQGSLQSLGDVARPDRANSPGDLADAQMQCRHGERHRGVPLPLRSSTCACREIPSELRRDAFDSGENCTLLRRERVATL